MIDYISRYGLDFNPFIKNTKDIVVETSEYNEIIYRLNYLLNNKGFGVITGGPGRGKTTKQLGVKLMGLITLYTRLYILHCQHLQ
ncbi:hypothetical protein HZR23_10155 [Serpentinicella alkaliphila]|uniref:hypothetical protein n=1 Tax=Serpentinicella alkaliphila TaxID=1734049 RepID=UPI001BC83C8B|nr:hypothetical protein [Serpentinicella alkaliphila]QUH26061.1 hypothetical protein HZR23_10155 [Serpentinicella alkaliphila]